jgi:hypothetical protein
MATDTKDEKATRLDRQARVLLEKLEGRASLSLGDEARELVQWMVQQGLVDAEERTGGGFRLKAKPH